MNYTMNSQLIKKVIQTNNVPCPEFVFANPLLDRNVAKALSKSFVEMFTTSRQTTNVHNNLRHTVLNNVRKLCKVQPENHLEVTEDITDVISECYIENILEVSENAESLDKELDEFLLRRINDLSFNPKIETVHNPEIIQALINLNPYHAKTLSKNVLSWSIDNKNLNILRSLWTSELAKDNNCNDISVKFKSEIEKYMLQTIHFIIVNKDIDMESMFDNDDLLKQLVTKCSASHNCFQICSGIMNYVFISTSFDLRIQTFIELFVKNVKQLCTETTLSVLYPTHLSHIALLLDFDVNKLSGATKLKYMDVVINYLHDLNDKSENSLIMLLSHFPQWFEIYFVIKKL